MLALAILGVLMGALVPAVRGWHEGGKFTATLKTAAALTEAVRQYRLATGSWPASWADLSGRYLATASPTTPWGGGFTLMSTARYAEITTTVPLGSPRLLHDRDHDPADSQKRFDLPAQQHDSQETRPAGQQSRGNRQALWRAINLAPAEAQAP
jgi:type II secretory pathway pseudopilin PulG